jgi:hypothetical protein
MPGLWGGKAAAAAAVISEHGKRRVVAWQLPAAQTADRLLLPLDAVLKSGKTQHAYLP